jgi:hypothetical protein
LDSGLKKREADLTRRQLRIYFDALDEAKEKGKDTTEAKNYANNELTRAGIQRMDYKQKLVDEINQKREIERYMRLAGGKKD